jgi:hypothetical protein
MAVDPNLTTLLKRYEELRSAGRPVTPEELCQGRPELLDELRHNLEVLALLDSLLGEKTADAATLVAPDAGPAAPPGPRRRPARPPT